MLRSTLLLAVLAVFAGVVAAQEIPVNPCPPKDHECFLMEATTINFESISVSFDYVVSTGDLCYINFVTVVGPQSNFFNDQGGAQLPVAGSKVTTDALGEYVTSLVLPGFTTLEGSGTFGVKGGFTSVVGPASSTAYIEYSRPTTPGGPLHLVINKQVKPVTGAPGTDNNCGLAVQDPHFSGFLGQQFGLEGEDGLVYNVLSASNMQLNTRLVKLNVGDALTRAEMKMARLKSLFALPSTYWFDHAGPYMTELGVAMLNGQQLYAKAGAYVNGWASVQLDGANFSVSEESVVLGSGADAITISRPTAHQIVIETAAVSLTFTNSDNFFNIENAHLKDNFSFQKSPMGGALGQTANPLWQAHNKDSKWRAQVELDALVESNDLFELSAPAGTVAA